MSRGMGRIDEWVRSALRHAPGIQTEARTKSPRTTHRPMYLGSVTRLFGGMGEKIGGTGPAPFSELSRK